MGLDTWETLKWMNVTHGEIPSAVLLIQPQHSGFRPYKVALAPQKQK